MTSGAGNHPYARTFTGVAVASGLAVVSAVVYLCVLALAPGVRPSGIGWLGWFGAPGSWVTVLTIVVLFGAAIGFHWLARRSWPIGFSTIVLASTAIAAALLAVSSYWRCHGASMPGIGPLASSLSLFVGSFENPVVPPTDPTHAWCGQMPVALDVARFVAIATLLTAAIATGFRLFRSQIDRARIRFARRITAVVGLDDDCLSIVAAVAEIRTPGNTLVVITRDANRDCVRTARALGARVLEINLHETRDLGSLRIWRHLRRLYLLAEDPEVNFDRLREIDAARERHDATHRRGSPAGDRPRVRIPVTVRIDDPWQAEIWRRRYLGGARHRWAPDAIGKYELTAAAIAADLLDRSPIPDTVYICGSSLLTSALCSEFAQLAREFEEKERVRCTQQNRRPADLARWEADIAAMERRIEQLAAQRRDQWDGTDAIEHDELKTRLAAERRHREHTPDEIPPASNSHGDRIIIPELCVIAPDATGLVRDHDIRQARIASGHATVDIDAIDRDASVDAITDIVDAASGTPALILTENTPQSGGTRLATRFPDLPIVSATGAGSDAKGHLIGNLTSIPVTLTVHGDTPQDTWERAARLLHEVYSIGSPRTPSTMPWAELKQFYRDSNRRAVLNALWMVEDQDMGNSTWNSLESNAVSAIPTDLVSRAPREQAAALGFDEARFLAMVEHEHKDWYDHLEDAGWSYADPPVGESRSEAIERKTIDDETMTNRRMIPWSEVSRGGTNSFGVNELLHSAEQNLTDLLRVLRVLGFRSVPRDRVSLTTLQEPGGFEHGGTDEWGRYQRRGEVTARRREDAWTWTTGSGETMTARPGDWEVTDSSGKARSVAAAVFDQTHEHVGADRYRRVGVFRARRAAPGEVVETLEGPVVAIAGDWIVEGADGERWPVPDAHFRASYEPFA
ncbi:hypothetical protein [Gordonia sp. HS-NH1]|uniref:hypothetical protein n=1 Tax=Gordonia sp. HS-NH1 TaxID=1435068 RepID=UPI0006E12DB0|nr:hypothetical protein [Gordonia sp. HS-NH1]